MMGSCWGAGDRKKRLVVTVRRNVFIHSGAIIAHGGETAEGTRDFMNAVRSVAYFEIHLGEA